ncbi:hypothetical protein [Rossellomorea vietnamensis]|uniref:hypothetical protein n=1 Tax=Rossellomorea vietnamensis TaxID=218284 RepID=UPI00054E1442|nr:hypothetical protein [Rossellomorea vietnamensis]
MGRREVLLSEGFAEGIKKELHPIFLGVELIFILRRFCCFSFLVGEMEAEEPSLCFVMEILL